MWRRNPLALLCVATVSVLAACNVSPPVATPCDPATGQCETPEPQCDPARGECEGEVPGAAKVTFLSPAEGETLSIEPWLVIFRVEEGESAIAKVEATHLPSDESFQPSAQLEDGTWTYAPDTPSYDGVVFTLRVRVVDAAGRETVAQRSLRVDTLKPRCDILFPTNTMVGGATETTVLRFEAKDGSGVAAGRVSVDDGATWADGTVVGEELHYEWAVPRDFVSRINALVEVTDPHGNLCSGSHQLNVDTRPPVVTVLEPQPQGSGPLRAGGPNQDELTVRVSVQDDEDAFFLDTRFDFDDGEAPRAMTGTGNERAVTVPLAMEDHVLHRAKVVVKDSFGNVTTVPLDVLVDRVPPQIGGITPAPATQFNASTLAGQTQVMTSWTVSDGDPAPARSARASNSAPWTPVTVDQLPVTTSASDDGTRYDVFLRAVDSFGNESLAQTYFTVDVVAPAVAQWSHANNGRMQPRALTLQFSEPVVPAGGGAGAIVTLSPNPTGATGTLTNNLFTVPGLRGDTVYTAVLAAGSVTDLSGNPVAQSTRTFHTEPNIPASGTTLLTNVLRFDATADEDGVVTLAVEVSGGTQGTYRLFSVDPVLGMLVQRAPDQPAGTQTKLQVNAARSLNGLAADRVGGWQLSFDYGGNPASLGGWYSAGAATYEARGDELLVPVPRGCADPQNAGRVGFVSRVTGQFARANMPSIHTGLAVPQKVGHAHENLWAALGIGGTQAQPTMHLNARSCVCAAGNSSCSFDGAVQLGSTDGDVSRMSLAAAPMRIVAVYPTAGGFLNESCYGVTWPGCTSGFCSQPGVSTASHPLGTELVVAPKYDGNRILGARRTGLGNVELVRKDLSSSCGAPWTVLGQVPQSANATRFRPVRLGSHSAVLYLEGGALKVWYP